ncbi:MAG: AMP-binding protein [Bacteroidales bacterium]|nr:AMP-binding protein [Bacteroidales bacterium]
MKRTVLQMLRNAAKSFPDTDYSNQKGDSGWDGMTYPEILKESRFLAAGLMEMGLKKDEKIALLSEGRNRWISGEFGILFAGCINVPLSIKLLPDEVMFRLNHSDSKAVFLSRNTFEKVASVWKQVIMDIKIIYLDDDLDQIKDKCKEFGINCDKDIVLYSDLVQKGMNSWDQMEEELLDLEDAILEEDIVTISYTSGTTGDPKGIMLSHLNYHANCHDAMHFFDVNKGDRLYIILPLDHSFAHTVGIYAGLLKGLNLYFVDARGGGVQTLKNIPINLVEANPHFMLTVPALTGNFMLKIKDGVASKGKFANRIFQMGLDAGRRMFRDGHNKAPWYIMMANAIPYSIANKMIFSKVRKIFGESIRFCVGGGALLDIRQQVFFYSLGVPVYQGYGLSEATPIISANTPDVHKLGTSGKVISNIEVKIIKSDETEAAQGEQGEIVIRGNNVMKGYYKNEEATKNTIKNGWLYTGDLGYFDEDEFLIVVGREKALLISADGEKYSPEGIEEAIQNSADMIQQVMVYNDMQKYTTAIITLNTSKVQSYIKMNEIADPEVLLKAIKQDINRFKDTSEYKNQFPEKWIPTTFQIAPELFTEQNHLINSSMKMVRHKIQETYAKQIEFMYSTSGSNIVNPLNVDSIKGLLPFD